MLDDARVHAEVRAMAGDFEPRVLQRAGLLAAGTVWREAILRWQGRARLLFVVAFVLALVLGFGAAAGVLGDGSRPVNVLWTLGGLLGVHLLSLLVWLLSLVVQARAQGG
ncbi:MAG: DUF2868 domain-containing protein, partial [Thauera sp.]